ncbi:MAG TPA: FprA family A-type flavoprotein [Candidatus Omnitrophota bacterium]|nr:FprA family A-type flavoprotein [Candidatus Omnitrophota bacterium]
MPAREVKPGSGVFAVGALDWDRRLFDELIPLPDGTTYNSYLLKGKDKTALIDTVDPTRSEELFANLKELGITSIDYIIAHHGEQDHSGSIPAVLKAFPMARVVTNAKCRAELVDLLAVPDDKFVVVEDRQTLPLGGKTLEFILTPWVHWPETMVTYVREEEILFTCDFFGSHLASSSLYSDNEAEAYRSAKRYFAEIMMPFRQNITGNLEKIKGLKIGMIAPSHGPVHRRPEFIINAYRDWVSDAVKNEVVIPFVSMHGSTRAMIDHFVGCLMKRGVGVKPFDLPRTDVGELAMSLVDAATVVIGTPTVLTGPHPAAVYAAFLANALRPKTRYVSLIGSFGWAGRMPEVITGMVPNLKAEMLAPVIAKGYPKPSDLAALDALAELIYNKHQNDQLVLKGA